MHWRRTILLMLLFSMALGEVLLTSLACRTGFATAAQKLPLDSDQGPDENSAVIVETDAAESLSESTRAEFCLARNLCDNIPHARIHFFNPVHSPTLSSAALFTFSHFLI